MAAAACAAVMVPLYESGAIKIFIALRKEALHRPRAVQGFNIINYKLEVAGVGSVFVHGNVFVHVLATGKGVE